MASDMVRAMLLAALALMSMVTCVAGVASGPSEIHLATRAPKITAVFPAPSSGCLTVTYAPYATDNYEAPATQMVTLTRTPAATTTTVTVAVDVPSAPGVLHFDSFVPTINVVYPEQPLDALTVSYVPFTGTALGAAPDVAMTTTTESIASGIVTIRVLSVDYHSATDAAAANAHFMANQNAMTTSGTPTTTSKAVFTSTITVIFNPTWTSTTLVLVAPSTTAPAATKTSSAAIPNMINPVQSLTRHVKAFWASVLQSLDAAPRHLRTSAATPGIYNPLAYASEQIKKIYSRDAFSVDGFAKFLFGRHADSIWVQPIENTFFVHTINNTSFVNTISDDNAMAARVGNGTNDRLPSPGLPNCNDCWPVRMLISPMVLVLLLIVLLTFALCKWGSWRSHRKEWGVYQSEVLGVTLVVCVLAFTILPYMEVYEWSIKPQVHECILNGCYAAIHNGTIPWPTDSPH